MPHNGSGLFLRIPLAVAERVDLPLGAKVVYGVLCMHARAGNNAYPGQGTIGREVGLGQRQVRRMLDLLVEKGLIAKRQRGLRRTNLYSLADLPPSESRDRPTATGLNQPDLTGQDRSHVSDIREQRKREGVREIDSDYQPANRFSSDSPLGSARDTDPILEVFLTQCLGRTVNGEEAGRVRRRWPQGTEQDLVMVLTEAVRRSPNPPESIKWFESVLVDHVSTRDALIPAVPSANYYPPPMDWAKYGDPEEAEEPKLDATSPDWVEETFAEFWKVVWVRRGKAAARRAWASAIKNPDHAKRVIDAARRMGRDLVSEAENNDRNIIHPARWIADGRYDDEPLEISLRRMGIR